VGRLASCRAVVQQVLLKGEVIVHLLPVRGALQLPEISRPGCPGLVHVDELPLHLQHSLELSRGVPVLLDADRLVENIPEVVMSLEQHLVVVEHLSNVGTILRVLVQEVRKQGLVMLAHRCC